MSTSSLQAQFIYPEGYGGLSIGGQYSRTNAVRSIYGDASLTFSRLSYGFTAGADNGENIRKSFTYGLGMSVLISNPKASAKLAFGIAFQESSFEASEFTLRNRRYRFAEVKSSAYIFGPTVFKRISLGGHTALIPSFTAGISILDFEIDGVDERGTNAEILDVSLTVSGLAGQFSTGIQYFNKHFGFGIRAGFLVPYLLRNGDTTL